MGSIAPFIRNLHIVDKDGVSQRLGPIMSWPQQDLLSRVDGDLAANRRIRKQVLKARQVGMSTMIEGIQFAMAMMRENFRGLVLTHENDASAHLLSMMHHYYATFWAKDAYPTKHAAVNQLAWKPNNSHVKIATAKNVDAGVSRTIHYLHASEVALWPAPEALMTGLLQTIPQRPRTFVFLESTARGVGGYFYDTWYDADSEFEHLFYPWWAHPQYVAEFIGLGELARGAFLPMDDEERHLIGFFSKARKINGVVVPPMDSSEIKSRLVWRRKTLRTECRGDLDTLHQEYPAEPEEAFIATGSNVFNLEHLRTVYEPIEGDVGVLVREGGAVRFIKNPSGPLTIFKYPSESREFGWYMIGGDPKKAVEGDFACAQVINRRSWEQCAELRIKCDQSTFGEYMIMLGQMYNNAMVAPEAGIGGGGVVNHVIAKGYPHIWQHRKANKMPGQLDNQWGWITNAQTKQEAVGNLQSALVDACDPVARDRGIGMRIHSRVLFHEMKNYITLPDGGFGNADGAKDHDDTVMAWAISLTCTKYEQIMIKEDPRYQAPRFHSEGHKSTLRTVEEGERYEEVLGMLGVEEGGVMVGAGKEEAMQYQGGRGEEVGWIEGAHHDMFGEGEFE